MADTPYIAVIGPGEASDAERAVAAEVGRSLAEAGAIVVTGGRGGVMEAASRGAREADGMTLGILPGNDRREANEWVAVAVPTGMGEARNALIARTADGIIAVGGEWGTLSEIAFACKAGKPVAGIGSWNLDGIERCESAAEAVTTVLHRLG